ncbi:MAG TPA: hypothetical protein DD738_05065 [Ruminiclostridium sp.]|nr:hypothetical protein [Ruminiclostridium sp.]
MADFLTHILLADSVLKQIESRRILEGAAKKRSLYHLGAQGPDIFFYYNCFPGSGRGPFRELGDTMHREKTGAFLKRGFQRLQSISYDKNWTDLAIYLSGFICHFTLDRFFHPYVHWAADQWIWGMDGTPRHVTHEQVEMALDIIFWTEAKKIPAYKTRTRKLADIGPAWPEGIASFLQETFSELYGIEAGESEMNKVLIDFYRGNDLLFDPKGWKKGLVNWLEGFTGGGIKPPKHPRLVNADPAIDWANRKKRTWANPFVDGETSNLTADELFLAASDAAASHINTLFSRIQKSEDIEDLFPDISYITGTLINEQ